MPDAALAGGFETITSPALLEELRRGIADPKLQAVIGDADEIVEFLTLAAIVITPAKRSCSPATPTTTGSSQPP